MDLRFVLSFSEKLAFYLQVLFPTLLMGKPNRLIPRTMPGWARRLKSIPSAGLWWLRRGRKCHHFQKGFLWKGWAEKKALTRESSKHGRLFFQMVPEMAALCWTWWCCQLSPASPPRSRTLTPDFTVISLTTPLHPRG